MIQIVADLGNSRLKWGRLDGEGRLVEAVAVPVDDPAAWDEVLERWVPAGAATTWAISSVHPPAAARLGEWLAGRGSGPIRWYRSAADVPVRHVLEQPDRAGSDRALAVLAATKLRPAGRGGLVVSCGTAVTVERIARGGEWLGGAIAPGLALAATALNRGTAQLPWIPTPGAPPPAWGRSTEPALAAGIFWGTVGAIRELIARGSEGLGPAPWLVWTGGDAAVLAPQVAWPLACVQPELVLRGLAFAAFGGGEFEP